MAGGGAGALLPGAVEAPWFQAVGELLVGLRRRRIITAARARMTNRMMIAAIRPYPSVGGSPRTVGAFDTEIDSVFVTVPPTASVITTVAVNVPALL